MANVFHRYVCSTTIITPMNLSISLTCNRKKHGFVCDNLISIDCPSYTTTHSVSCLLMLPNKTSMSPAHWLAGIDSVLRPSSWPLSVCTVRHHWTPQQVRTARNNSSAPANRSLLSSTEHLLHSPLNINKISHQGCTGQSYPVNALRSVNIWRNIKGFYQFWEKMYQHIKTTLCHNSKGRDWI